MELFIGLVNWFDDEKGYGTIMTINAHQLFLHVKNFSLKPKKIYPGLALVFQSEFDTKRNRETAIKCREIHLNSDWEIICTLFGKNNHVEIKKVIVNEELYRNYRDVQYIQSYELIDEATKQYFAIKKSEELVEILKDYYHKLDKKYFVNYCNLIDKTLRNNFENEIANKTSGILFNYISNNLNDKVIFYAWRNKSLEYIGITLASEYEIPESIIRKFSNEIDVPELQRIKAYTYGSKYCAEIADKIFNNINDITKEELEKLFSYVEFCSEDVKCKNKQWLEDTYYTIIKENINIEIENYGIIENQSKYYDYIKLKGYISKSISQDIQTKIENLIHELIIANCSEGFKKEIWIQGINVEINFETIIKFFFDSYPSGKDRETILNRLKFDEQIKLLKLVGEKEGWLKSYNELKRLVLSENSIYDSEDEINIFEYTFIEGNKHKELTSAFYKTMIEGSNEKEKLELFFNGILNEIPEEYIDKHISEFNYAESERIIRFFNKDEKKICKFLIEKISNENISEHEHICDLKKYYLNINSHKLFSHELYLKIDNETYFNLWKKKCVDVFPKEYIKKILLDDYNTYTEIIKCISWPIERENEIVELLIENLIEKKPVTNRKIFYKKYNHVKCLLEIDGKSISIIKDQGDDLFNILIWVLGKEEVFDFDLLKNIFIYFLPEEQVKIIKKLFYLKAINSFELDIEKLDQLLRIDYDLYKINLEFYPEIPFDISSDIIIKSLLNYKENGKFLVESELLSVVLKDLKNDRKKRFKFDQYFEPCLGRYKALWSWGRNGDIRKIEHGPSYFFEIVFEYDEKLVEKVRRIPGRHWDASEKRWIIPLNSENDVIKFARENRFYLDLGGDDFKNNPQMYHFDRIDKPTDILFCEGRLANKVDNNFKKEFWWCNGRPCFAKCETIHPPNDWEKYTLLDFCVILGINTDETNHMGDFIPKGYYYQYIGLINRFNRLLEKLYCRECGDILFPIETAHFAAHNVVWFMCENEKCSQHHHKIYLNHCLNGQCNSIIDSRDSKECHNGLYICDKCGSCCSHAMLERRLANLRTTGGYIHPQLIYHVENKLGHLERAEYFCYKCGKKMEEIAGDIFLCHNCKVKYDTTSYRIERPHKHLPHIQNKNTENIDFYID